MVHAAPYPRSVRVTSQTASDCPVEVDEKLLRWAPPNEQQPQSQGTEPIRAVVLLEKRSLSVSVTGPPNKSGPRSHSGPGSESLQGFCRTSTLPGAKVSTDGMQQMTGCRSPMSPFRHSVSEYVRGMAHTQTAWICFWATLKRVAQRNASINCCHPSTWGATCRSSPAKHNMRDSGTLPLHERDHGPARRWS